jgi:hypothetical protein
MFPGLEDQHPTILEGKNRVKTRRLFRSLSILRNGIVHPFAVDVSLR